MSDFREAQDQCRTLDRFLRECDEPIVYTEPLEVPEDYYTSCYGAVEEWTPGSFDLPPSVHPESLRPQELSPTHHELYFLARYWTDRQLYARHLEVIFPANPLRSKVDPMAEVRIREIAKLLGNEAIDEIRADLLCGWRSKLGEQQWHVFMAYSLDDQNAG